MVTITDSHASNSVSGRAIVIFDFATTMFDGSVENDPFKQVWGETVIVGALSGDIVGEDHEWDEIARSSLSNNEIDAVADYLRRTRQASE
jgi:hypothetical protein